ICGSLDTYRRIFAHYAGWDWDAVSRHAKTYVLAIEGYREHLLEEMQGIAEGAGLAFEDILALNVRTEVMFAAVARAADRSPAAAEGCTTVVALPEATADRHTLLGQNWDWIPGTGGNVVVLEAEPDDGPAFVTLVEAGLLAKTGLNSAGIGLVTNALVSDADRGEPAVPYHVILRAILESERASQALNAITRHRRASSANYLIAHRDGEAINVEAAPGDYSRVFIDFPDAGLFSHTNHFTNLRFDLRDVGIWDGPDSLLRLRRVQRLLDGRRGRIDVAVLREVLSDHFSHPESVCAHPDPRCPDVEQYATQFSIVMDLDAVAIWLGQGNPCQSELIPFDTQLAGRDAARNVVQTRAAGIAGNKQEVLPQ
ncbi:MAG: C45 family autoproteolytic acyltransferase/hydrolase, partial [Anaerolineae bacterium]